MPGEDLDDWLEAEAKFGWTVGCCACAHFRCRRPQPCLPGRNKLLIRLR